MADKPIIIIDDNAEVRDALNELLELAGYRISAYANATAALAVSYEDWPGIIICDVRMPSLSGLDFLDKVQQLDSELPVILITGHGDIQMAVKSMQNGAYDFIEKPFRREILLDVVAKATQKRQLIIENRHLKATIAQQALGGIIGQSPPIQALKAQITKIAPADVNTLINGETGTGKELVARCLHQQSQRKDGPFVALNCAALPDSMIEAELFGHEAWAFTDAKKARVGKFEYAHKGTIFLDEIESIPMHLAVKILRVLQERKIERLGSNQSIDVDIRVIAASKVDLKAVVERGDFREDLYYRLNVVDIYLPPLRSRGDDILLLFRSFIAKAAERFDLPVPPLSAETISTLLQHNWPGNVRELINIAERFILTNRLLDQSTQTIEDEPTIQHSLPMMLEAYEQQMIKQALAQAHGNIKQTYEALGIPRKTLYDKLTKYNISRQHFTDKNSLND